MSVAVRYRNDLDYPRQFPIEKNKWKVAEHQPARTGRTSRPTTRGDSNAFDRPIQFLKEIPSGGLAPFQIPVVGGFDFFFCLVLKFDCLICHEATLRKVVLKAPARELTWIGRTQDEQCASRSPRSTLPERRSRCWDPGSGAGKKLVLRALLRIVPRPFAASPQLAQSWRKYTPGQEIRPSYIRSKDNRSLAFSERWLGFTDKSFVGRGRS